LHIRGRIRPLWLILWYIKLPSSKNYNPTFDAKFNFARKIDWEFSLAEIEDPRA